MQAFLLGCHIVMKCKKKTNRNSGNLVTRSFSLSTVVSLLCECPVSHRTAIPVGGVAVHSLKVNRGYA